MAGIILQTHAVAIDNHGGGIPTKTIRQEFSNRFGLKKVFKQRMVSKTKAPGSDYVIFNCSRCGARNRQCVYQAKGQVGESLSFKCNRCLVEVEVSKPIDLSNVIQKPEPPKGLYGPNGKLI
jgi:hypothetical protein